MSLAHMNNSPARILIIDPYADIDSNLTMAFLLESLGTRNVEVDVLHRKVEGFLPPEPFGGTIHLKPLPNFFFGSVVSSGERSYLKSLVSTPLQLLSPIRAFDQTTGFYPVVFRLIQARRYSTIVGVDPLGIAVADRLNRWAKRPLVYISFEILCAEEVVSEDEAVLMRLERSACRGSSLVLIQDEERLELFCRETSFPRDKIVMVPVAPPPQNVVKSDYLRATLGIPWEKRIVLFCGNLWSWSSRDQLAEMVSYWPHNYCLVIHLPSTVDKRMAQYLKRLTETGKIYWSSTPLPRKEMASMIASADFGLAPYITVPDGWMGGENQYHIGFGSSKVSCYAACGLPVLARRLPVFDREFTKYQCGKVYDRIAETGKMLEEMDRNYSHYSEEARRFYRERLNPVGGMQRFCNKLLDLAGVRVEEDMGSEMACGSMEGSKSHPLTSRRSPV